MPPLGLPDSLSTHSSDFDLDSSAVAGFFGGDEAISAMATVHLYEGRWYLGWYNLPGSYTLAKHFGKTANWCLWDGLFPGPNDPPAVACGLDGEKGEKRPRYIAALSGTMMETGHLGYLAMERRKKFKPEIIAGRKTAPTDVVYLAMNHVNYEEPVQQLPLWKALPAAFPIIASAATCVMCALVHDWYCFSLILFGIISNSFASFIIGKGRVIIESVKKPASGSPPGHGILMGDRGVVVIKGEERDVNVITKGHFDLQRRSQENGKGNHGREVPRNAEKGRSNTREGKAEEKSNQAGEEDSGCRYHWIGVCSFMLLVQFLSQLLLIPQGTLFGQIMFLVSLAASWAYNSYLSSLERDKIQASLLFRTLKNTKMRRFRAGTRTTVAVFACLLLFHGVESSSLEIDQDRRNRILDECLPKDTLVWKRWRAKVVEQLRNTDDTSLTSLMQGVYSDLSESEYGLLEQLLEDARAAFKGYFDVRDDLPADSSQSKKSNE